MQKEKKMKKVKLFTSVLVMALALVFAGCKHEDPQPLSGGIDGSYVFIPGRNIIIRSTLWACDHEVTQAEYQSVMGVNPSYFKNNPAEGETQGNRPVEQVSWYDTLVYCNKRSIAEGITPCYTINGKTNPAEWGTVPTIYDDTWDAVICNFDANGYRLPTVAEWEYLARGGNMSNSGQTKYSGSDDLGEVAWYMLNSDDKTHEVKKKVPNALGLYDMNGNVWEWCWDWDGIITTETPDTGPIGEYHMTMGGDWSCHSRDCCVNSGRFTVSREMVGSKYTGFRVVRSSIN